MRIARHPWLARAEQVGRWLENALLLMLLGALVLLASGQILLRNLLSMGLPWADGLVRLIVLWLALLGAIAASRDHRHIAINLADRYLPKQIMMPVNFVVHAFTALVAGFMAWYSASFVLDSRAFGDVLLGGWPAWWFQAILPVGFALIAYRYALRAAGQLGAGGAQP